MGLIFTPTGLDTVLEVQPKVFEDARGLFVKTLSYPEFKAQGLSDPFPESFYSISHQNVIRGMHFQTPPYEAAKLVLILSGEILDVIVDIRKSSPTYGQSTTLTLTEKKRNGVYIPTGFAHGFLTLSESATVLYYQTQPFNAEHDKGLHFESFGFSWPVKTPILSARDLAHPPLEKNIAT